MLETVGAPLSKVQSYNVRNLEEGRAAQTKSKDLKQGKSPLSRWLICEIISWLIDATIANTMTKTMTKTRTKAMTMIETKTVTKTRDKDKGSPAWRSSSVK